MSDTFTYNGKEYCKIMDVWQAAKEMPDLHSALGLLNAYREKYYHGIANMRYFVGGCPIMEIYNHFSVFKDQIQILEEELTKLRDKQRKDYYCAEGVIAEMFPALGRDINVHNQMVGR